MTASINWLLLSDVHAGAPDQDRLWPRFDYIFMRDLETTISKVERLDGILITGDLTQRGSRDQFDRFDEILDRIRERIGQFTTVPKVIGIPGNHDLERSGPLEPANVALSQFWTNTDLQAGMWKESSSYAEFLAARFAGFTDWRSRAIGRGVHFEPTSVGLLPGDASYCIDGVGARTAVVALNSAWLQLGGGDYRGQLHVDTTQLLTVVGATPDKWISEFDVALLMTHHPSNWLHPQSLDQWNAEIDPPGRFDLHLFGHMHEPITTSTAVGGALSRRSMQAPSLFGLERFGPDQVKRIQGYSANTIAVNPSKNLESWPRRLIEVPGGSPKLVPDASQDISETTGSFIVQYATQPPASPNAGASQSTFAPTNLTRGLFDLSLIRYPIGDFAAHKSVRQIEQRSSLDALTDKRAFWLVADWGMGDDGFIAAVDPLPAA